jgi:hypothetical protein
MIRIAQATAIALVLLPNAALAQQQRETFKDANGRTLGWSTSNGNGGTSYYDSSARNTGRSITGSNGTTTFYNSSGHSVGSVTTTKPQASR